MMKQLIEVLTMVVMASGMLLFMAVGVLFGIGNWLYKKIHLTTKITYAVVLMLKFDVVTNLPFLRRWYHVWKRWVHIKYISFKKG